MQSFLSIQYVQAFINRFEYRSNAYHPDQYSNLFLNAYINRHVHPDYLKMIKFYSHFGIRDIFLYRINTNFYEIQAIRVNTSKSTYTFTSVISYHKAFLTLCFLETPKRVLQQTVET